MRNKLKVIAFLLLFTLIVSTSFLSFSQIMRSKTAMNNKNAALGVDRCEVMICDCYVPGQYAGGTLWLGVLTDHCVPYQSISSCEPFC